MNKQTFFPMMAMIFAVAGFVIMLLQDTKSLGAGLLITGMGFNIIGMVLRRRTLNKQ